ncbi:hypothetical protein [Plesiocystis pacifica]|uniref:hypothetical protein n=1 Tax=Plesiocystis pacifica TaxID=191768 RepID=UPI00030799CF|nr:hypothetical protein [Plesiocystis pacifica]
MQSLRKLLATATFALVSASMLTACPSDDGSDDDVGTDEEDTGMDDSMMDEETTMGGELSHAADIQPIWDANCAVEGCHVAGAIAPDLSDGYTAMVGVASTQAAGVDYVVAGDAANSYVVAKLAGTQSDLGGAGSQMPLNLEALSDADQALITDWINSGANP